MFITQVKDETGASSFSSAHPLEHHWSVFFQILNVSADQPVQVVHPRKSKLLLELAARGPCVTVDDSQGVALDHHAASPN